MQNTEDQNSISISISTKKEDEEKELENYRQTLDQAYEKLEYSSFFLDYLEIYEKELDLVVNGQLPKKNGNLYKFSFSSWPKDLKKIQNQGKVCRKGQPISQKCLLYASVRIQNQDPPLTLLHLVAKIFVQPHSFGFYEDHIGEKIMKERSTELSDQENSDKNKEEDSVDVSDESKTLKNDNSNKKDKEQEKEQEKEKDKDKEQEEEKTEKDQLENNESQKGTEINEPIKKNEFDPEIIKDKNSFHFTSNYLMDNVKYFAELNGFKNLFLLILSTKYEITLFNVKRILKPIEHGTLYLTRDYSESFLPLINKIFEKIYNLDFDTIRRIEKEKLKKSFPI